MVFRRYGKYTKGLEASFEMHNRMFPQALFQCCNNVDCLHLNDVENIYLLRLILIRHRFLTLDVAYVENLFF